MEEQKQLCITLIDGPAPAEIVPGACLEFQGLCRQCHFALTVAISNVLDTPPDAPPENAANALKELMNGVTKKGEDVWFEGTLRIFSQSNANGTSAAWVGASYATIRGLWRKSHPHLAAMLPKGNGFLDILP